MKNILLVLLLVLGTLDLVIAQQLGNPIRPYRESGYTTNEVKNFALGSSQVSVDYRREMLRLVNNALASAGESVVVNENNISWILENIHSIHVDLRGGSYRNSRILNGSFNIYNDRDNFSGSVGEFLYGKCRVILYKLICMNLLDVQQNSFVEQQNPTQTISEPTIVPTQITYVPSVVLKTEEYSAPINPTILASTNVVRTKTWFGKNWWWVVPVGVAVLSGGGYLLSRDRHVSQAIEIRSMPGGIPSVGTPTQPGLPSDPRGMPSGTGMNFNTVGGGGITLFRF